MLGDILAGRYPEGSMLPPERELASRYGITRTSLKHGLVRLAQRGLVETRQGVGTRVRTFGETGGTELLPLLLVWAGSDAVAHLLEARRLIGPIVAARAAEVAGEDDHRALHDVVARIAECDDAAKAHLLESEYHRLLARASGNVVFRLLVNTMIQSYEPVRSLFDSAFDDPPALARELSPVVRAVTAGRALRASGAAHRYLERSETRLRIALGLPAEDGGVRRSAP